MTILEVEMLRVAWWIANAGTGLAYMCIPFELYYWVRGLHRQSFVPGIVLFATFILFCGIHHLTMVGFDLYELHHIVHPIQGLNDMAMLTVSSVAVVYLQQNRTAIRAYCVRLAERNM